jgi:gas vesicle protein
MRWRTRTDEDDWYDEDDEPYEVGPYVIVERRETGIGPFLIGLALGAGAALLFAPQSGEETRRGIARSARRAQDAAQDFVGDVSGTVADKFKEVRASVEERIEATLDAVDDKRRRVSNAFHAGRAAAREARGELEERIAESKAAYKDS